MFSSELKVMHFLKQIQWPNHEFDSLNFGTGVTWHLFDDVLVCSEQNYYFAGKKSSQHDESHH